MINIAVIGAGRIGQVHARAAANHPDAKLVLISDPVETAAQSLAKKYGVEYNLDAAAVFTDPRVDAVVIGSPTSFHVEQILQAVRAGKPVLCEKPVAQDSADVTELQQKLAGLDPTVMLGFNRRFDPSFAAMHQRIAAGEIGPLQQLTIISRDPAAPSKEYIAGSGGIFKDMSIHDFDTARFFLGDIVEVNTIPQNLDPELVETGDFDAAITVLKASSGSVATIINSRHCATGYDQRIEAFGPQGSLLADNLRPTTILTSNDKISAAKDPYLAFFLDRYVEAYHNEMSVFLQAVISGTKPTPGIADGAAALLIAEAAEKSARTGLPVKL